MDGAGFYKGQRNEVWAVHTALLKNKILIKMRYQNYKIFYEDGNFCTVYAIGLRMAYALGVAKAIKSGGNSVVETIEDEDGKRFSVVLKFLLNE